MYLGISPLLISNYSDIFIEVIPLFITEFLNVCKICCYRQFICYLFGVLAKTLISKVKVMSSNPDMSQNCIGKLLCIKQHIVI